MYKIVTHPGSAHKDDFLATSILLATLGDALVFRREPTQADLDDPDTYVVDAGMEHAPGRHNFDHHHDHSLPCAFHLVMQHLGHHEAASQMFLWYPHMSMIDVRGPYRTADHLGIDSSILFATSSPIDGYILSTFASFGSLSPGDLLYSLMKDLGCNLITLIDSKMKRFERLKVEAIVVPVQHLKAVFCDISDSPKLAMDLYLRQLEDPLVVMSITPSNRGSGWELLRLGDNMIVDFRVIEKCPEIHFVHTSGFLAKTHERLPMDEVVLLASRAILEIPH